MKFIAEKQTIEHNHVPTNNTVAEFLQELSVNNDVT